MDQTKPLEMPDRHYLSAAIGWLGLGNGVEAEKELASIAPPSRAHPDVLKVKWAIYADAEKWDSAAEIAKVLCITRPDEPGTWLNFAYATRRSDKGGLMDARKILTEARAKFSTEPTIAYNLACYECQLGDLVAARQWLEAAFKIGDPKNLKQMALKDPDLEPLWPEINRMKVLSR